MSNVAPSAYQSNCSRFARGYIVFRSTIKQPGLHSLDRILEREIDQSLNPPHYASLTALLPSRTSTASTYLSVTRKRT